MSEAFRVVASRRSTLFVLAGGKGRRLEALTGSTPKGLWGDGFEPPLSRVVRFAQESALFDGAFIIAPADQVGIFEAWASGFRLPVRVIPKCSARPRGVDDVLWAFESLPPSAVTVAHADTWFESDPFEGWRESLSDLEVAGGTEIVPRGAASASLRMPEKALISYEKNLATSPCGQYADRWPGMWRVSAELRLRLSNQFAEPFVESLIDAVSRRVQWRIVPTGRFINLNTPDHVSALREEF